MWKVASSVSNTSIKKAKDLKLVHEYKIIFHVMVESVSKFYRGLRIWLWLSPSSTSCAARCESVYPSAYFSESIFILVILCFSQTICQRKLSVPWLGWAFP